jgi:hypothetical protein
MNLSRPVVKRMRNDMRARFRLPAPRFPPTFRLDVI